MLKPSRCLHAAQWKSTLHLPRSTFPIRSSKKDWLKYRIASSNDLYAWQAEARKQSPPFVFHDGPPYANGDLHLGHALNKILKDFICRFHISQGEHVKYRPGWDCHGLPIELKALQQRGKDEEKMTALETRHTAERFARDAVKRQKASFQEWGVVGAWETPYITMEKPFVVRQLQVFKEMVKNGLIYRQKKPIYWSPSSGTALAEAELEYDEQHVSHSAYITYRVSGLRLSGLEASKVYAIIWTTTPWTLPANRVITFHKDIEYCLFSRGSEDVFIVAKARLEDVRKHCKHGVGQIRVHVDSILGCDLFEHAKSSYINPFSAVDQSPQMFLHADFVSESSGTGLVHCAPGHGFDDYKLCQSYGIEPFAPLDNDARFTDQAFPQDPQLLAGKSISTDGAAAVLEFLSRTGHDHVWGTHDYTHKYPIDWRTKQPVIIRATSQWFADLEPLKMPALGALEQVKFIPEAGRSRLRSFVSGRSEWCISRQRVWGVPIPALYDAAGEAVMTAESIEHIISRLETTSLNSWWTDEHDDEFWVAPSLQGRGLKRGRETMDVWFDSGTAWSQIAPRHGRPIADVSLEGSDQHRGWFQSSLLTYIASQKGTDHNLTPHAPYQTLLTHGFILDGTGKKMSKSLGNVVSPDEIIQGTLVTPTKQKGKDGGVKHDALGPDMLRLWVASSDFTKDVTVSNVVLEATHGSLHKLRNRFKWLLGALDDFDPSMMTQTATHLADRVVVARLHETISSVHAAYREYDFARGVSHLMHFVNTDLSAVYFEYAKDTLYTGSKAARSLVQSTCLDILKGLLHMIGPILPLLVTEVLHHVPSPVSAYLLQSPSSDSSSHFLSIPWGPQHSISSTIQSAQTTTDFSILKETASMLAHLTENARWNKYVGSTLTLHARLYLSEPIFHEYFRRMFPPNTSLATIEAELAEYFVFSGLDVVFVPPSQPSDQGEYEVSMRQRVKADADAMGARLGHGLPMEAPWMDELLFAPYGKWWSSVDRSAMTVTVALMPAKGDKCPRCWRHVVPKTKEEEEEETDKLCGRCEDVVAEQTGG